MVIKDHIGNVLPANHNVHLLHPWGADSHTVTLQPRVTLGKQPIVQKLDDWIKRRTPGNSLIGYIITRGNDVHVCVNGEYSYNFAQWNPNLVGKL